MKANGSRCKFYSKHSLENTFGLNDTPNLFSSRNYQFVVLIKSYWLISALKK